MAIGKIWRMTAPLPLVDDAGYWFSIWGGYAESPALNVKLLDMTQIHKVTKSFCKS